MSCWPVAWVFRATFPIEWKLEWNWEWSKRLPRDNYFGYRVGRFGTLMTTVTARPSLRIAEAYLNVFMSCSSRGYLIAMRGYVNAFFIWRRSLIPFRWSQFCEKYIIRNVYKKYQWDSKLTVSVTLTYSTYLKWTSFVGIVIISLGRLSL